MNDGGLQVPAQPEKIASHGPLSGGILHQFNNPLNYAMADTGKYTRFTLVTPEECS